MSNLRIAAFIFFILALPVYANCPQPKMFTNKSGYWVAKTSDGTEWKTAFTENPKDPIVAFSSVSGVMNIPAPEIPPYIADFELSCAYITKTKNFITVYPNDNQFPFLIDEKNPNWRIKQFSIAGIGLDCGNDFASFDADNCPFISAWAEPSNIKFNN